MSASIETIFPNTRASDPRQDGSPMVWCQVFDGTTGEPIVLPKQSPGTISELDNNGSIEESLCGTIN
jgi:hypothetical protein